jgi:hypothetical protein
MDKAFLAITDGWQNDDFDQLTKRLEKVHEWIEQNHQFKATDEEQNLALDLSFRANDISPHHPAKRRPH